MRVIWVDPGFATGLALYEGTASEHSFEAFELPAGEAMPWLHRQLEAGDVDHVGSEGIHIGKDTARKGDEVLRSVEQIGIARYLCFLFGVEFSTQMPNERKWTTDKKLRALGWWTAGSADHPREATRHLVKWLAEQDPDFRDRLATLLSQQ
jgi:hypothetical protein